MTVKIRMNPNLKAEVMKAAEEKLGCKISTEKQALESLQSGQCLSNEILAHLSAKGLIEVSDVTHLGTPLGQRDLLFTGFTESGRATLEG